MPRLPTRLEGPVLLAAAVHGSERGFSVGAWREDAWRDVGVPLPAGVASVAGSLPFRSAA